MPALPSAKRELFCQLTLQGAKYGWSQADIYKRAGYRSSGHSAEVAASRLLKNVEVQQRIAELSAPAVKRAQITVQTLLSELEATIAGAREAKQFGAVNGSLTLMGKLTGLLRDQIEVGGVGDFSRCESSEQVIDALFAALGNDPHAVLAGLDEMRAEVEARAATMAVNITPPSAPRRVDETERALALLRPKARHSRR
jgi:phage terminase small subunit